MNIKNLTKKQSTENIDFSDTKKARSIDPNPTNNKSSISDFDSYDSSFFLRYSSSIGLVITDIQGNIISINKAVTDLLGFTTKELQKMNVSELYENTCDRESLLTKLNEASTINNFETKLKHKNQTIISVIASIDHIKLKNANLLLTSLYDITQFKQNIDKNQIPEMNYQTLFSNAPIGIIVTNFQGELLVCNNAILKMLGYTSEELKMINVKDFYYDKNVRQKLLKLTEKLNSVKDFETSYKDKNGNEIPVLINTDKIVFNNQADILLASIRDISNIKQIETDLTQERDFSNAILDVTASLIIVLNDKGVVTRFNRACEQLTGYSANEIIGKDFLELIFIVPEITKELVDTILSGDFNDAYESIWISKNGEKHLVSWTGTVLLTNNGHLSNIIGNGIDITEWKNAENKLNAANIELAKQVHELETLTYEMNLINEMGEDLQICHNVNEACSISAQYIKKMFPDSNGALYLINPSKTQAEIIQAWGKGPYTKDLFEPTVCWAYRSGKVHLIDKDLIAVRCDHITGPQDGQYLCIPLLVNGDSIGILHLNYVTNNKKLNELTTDLNFNSHKMQIIITIAENIALTISNIQLKENLRQQSIRDALTGLFNRRYLEETLERELKRAEREKSTVGVIMFDIDHFKDFNDLEGHDAGDALLRELGSFLKNNMRGSDIVCRYGGEEFLAVLPAISCKNALIKADELRIGAKSLLVYHLGKPLQKCTLSLGVAIYPDHALTVEKLLKAADTALYEAKNNGRDRVVLTQCDESSHNK